MKPRIAHRPLGGGQVGLFLLESLPGCIDVTEASVQWCQAKSLGHPGRGGDPPAAGQRVEHIRERTADGVGAAHSHPHVQSTLVKSGRFAFTIGDETFQVGPGDAFVIPANAVHGCRALGEPGVLIDTFTPRRDDFL